MKECIRIDTRTLAVFRVVVGVLIVVDLALRARNFTYFYTDDGVVPRSLVLETYSESLFSVYHLTTDSRVIALLFVLQGLFAIQLIVGYRTRVATVLSFLFVVSLDHHNPFVLSYADTLFRLLLFWAIFLPLGERWSIDAVHRDREPSASVATVGSALILCQMVFMYVTNGLIKSQSDVWKSGDAAPRVLGLDEITFLLGDIVRGFPSLLEIGGLLWYYMLLFSWLLLVLRGRKRLLLVGMFVGGHLSFALTVRIGAFPYVALAGVFLFLQAGFWDDARALLERARVDVSRFEARAARLERVAQRVPDYRFGFGSERVKRMRRHGYTASIGVVVVCILFVAVVMSFNVVGAAADGGDDRPIEERVDAAILETLEESDGVKRIYGAAARLGVDQPMGWGVFANPDPRTTDRYYVFPAETASGERVDAYADRPLSYDRPFDQLQRQYGTYRERFYMNSVRRGGYSNDVAPILADHVCQRWAADHDEELASLNMYMVGEEVTMETIDSPADRERSYTEIYRHGCRDGETREIEPPA